MTTTRHTDTWGRTGSATAILALIVLLGAALRFYGLDEKYFWFDEVVTGLWYSGHDIEVLRNLEPQAWQTPRDLRGALQLDGGSRYEAILRLVARDDPQHTPLYYLALRAWAGFAGDSLAALRAFSALAGLALLPALYLLCQRLVARSRFEHLPLGLVAVALVTLSPFHIVYAQEARPYTLWLLWIALSSASLLRAEQKGGAGPWLLFTLWTLAGLYTQLLHLLVIAAQGLYVLSGANRQVVWRFILSISLALAGFAPWLLVLAGNFGTASDHLSWSARPVGWMRLAGMWAYNYSAVFFDPNLVPKYHSGTAGLLYASAALRLALLLPAGLACLALGRRWRSRPARFLLPLILVPFLGLALPDLLLGGIRSGGGNRYLAPSYLGLQIALAWWLSMGFARRPKLSGALLASLLAAGLFSGLLFNRSDTWWHKTVFHDGMDVARAINASGDRLVVESSLYRLLALANHLDEDIRVRYEPEVP